MAKMYEQWLIADFEPPANPEFQLNDWVLSHRERIFNTALMSRFAADIPRRLGGDATPEAIGQDKRFSKRLSPILIGVLYGQWRDDKARKDYKELEKQALTELDHHLRPLGAQVNWHEWVPENAEFLRDQTRFIASYFHWQKNSKAANRYVHRLTMEIALVANLYQKIFETPTENQD